MIAVIFGNERPQWASHYGHFAQNLIGEWECPSPEEKPCFEDLGGGYGLMFYVTGNEDFLERMMNEPAIVILVSEESAKNIYEKLYKAFIPYFSKKTYLTPQMQQQLKKGVENDGGEVLHIGEVDVYL